MHSLPSGACRQLSLPLSASSYGLHAFAFLILFAFFMCQGLCFQSWGGVCSRGLQLRPWPPHRGFSVSTARGWFVPAPYVFLCAPGIPSFKSEGAQKTSTRDHCICPCPVVSSPVCSPSALNLHFPTGVGPRKNQGQYLAKGRTLLTSIPPLSVSPSHVS